LNGEGVYLQDCAEGTWVDNSDCTAAESVPGTVPGTEPGAESESGSLFGCASVPVSGDSPPSGLWLISLLGILILRVQRDQKGA
jgi:hypothetical protein